MRNWPSHVYDTLTERGARFTDVDIDWELTPEEQRAFAARLEASDRIELGAP